MKKIIIDESKLHRIKAMIEESKDEILLPKFIFDRVRVHNTSLGNNVAFPENDNYPFDYQILKKRFREVTEAVNSLDGIESLDPKYLKSVLTVTMRKCREIERPIRNNLEKVCENAIARMFDIPEETVNIYCKLCDKIEPKHTFRIMPEEEDYTDFQFDDLDDASNASKVVYKRRLINSLIQGASIEYSRKRECYIDDIKKLNEELPELYDKIEKIGDFLLFTTQERITDDKPQQGSCVDVELGIGDLKTSISSQAIIFPYLLSETIRGMFEMFSAHGLPNDKSKANYILRQADYLLAEPWDMRFGKTLFDFISNGDTSTSNMMPFLFMKICKMPTNKFNRLMKEIFARTRKGDEYIEKLYNYAEDKMNNQNFDTMVQQKNSLVSVISDSYMTADELDDYIIEDASNEAKNSTTCPISAIDWRGNCDFIRLIDSTNGEEIETDVCYPFIALGDYGVTVGEANCNHYSLIQSINDRIGEDYYDFEDESDENDTTGRVHLIKEGKYKGYSIFLFWWLSHVIDEKHYFKHLVEDVCKELKLDYNKSCVACGGNEIEYSTVFFDNKPPIIEVPNQEKLHALHNSENKWQETSDFRKCRDEKNSKKYGGRTEAEYRYQMGENKNIDENKKHLTFDNSYYMHKSQANKEIPKEDYERALEVLKNEFPDYDYWNCLMYKPSDNIIRFDYSEDFDSCTEPSVQRRVIVNYADGTAKEGKRGADVWHGKADYWVDDSYDGFDIEKEKEWRKRYLDAISTHSEFGKRPHGESRANWLNHLIDLGLIDEYFERNGINDPIEYLKNNSTGKFKKGLLVQKYEEYKKNH